MYARISRLTAPPSRIDEVGRFEEESVHSLCERAGYRGFMLLAHPDDGTRVTITYWDSEAAMRACDDEAARRNPLGLDGVDVRSVERLQLIREG